MSAVIGQRLPKLDAPDKATGRTVYGHDVRLPGMLHGRILYSRYPHARVLSVDVSRALKLPGVKAIVTAADNPRVGAGAERAPAHSSLRPTMSIERRWFKTRLTE